jgi:exoribonuclease R
LRVALIGQTRQERLHFRRSHLGLMAQAMKADEPASPIHIRFFSSQAAMLIAQLVGWANGLSAQHIQNSTKLILLRPHQKQSYSDVDEFAQ